MKYVLSHLRRGLRLRFWMTLLMTAGLCFSSFLQSILQNIQQGSLFYQGYHNELIVQALSSDILASFLPVLAAIPISAGYLEDIKSKFARFLILREDYSGYLISQCLSCWGCGGCATLLGGLAAWGITALVFSPLEQVVKDYVGIAPQIASQLALVFLNGGLWAVVGMALSTVMESKYIAYISPFIVYYLLVILYERYFPDAWLLYPRNWLDLEIWPYGVGSAVVFLLELTFLSGLLFYFRGRRRLESL